MAAKCPPGYSWWPRERRCKPLPGNRGPKGKPVYVKPKTATKTTKSGSTSAGTGTSTSGSLGVSPILDTSGASAGSASGLPATTTPQTSVPATGGTSPNDAVYSTGTGPVMPLAYTLSTSYQEAVAQGALPSTAITPATASTDGSSIG